MLLSDLTKDVVLLHEVYYIFHTFFNKNYTAVELCRSEDLNTWRDCPCTQLGCRDGRMKQWASFVVVGGVIERPSSRKDNSILLNFRKFLSNLHTDKVETLNIHFDPLSSSFLLVSPFLY